MKISHIIIVRNYDSGLTPVLCDWLSPSTGVNCSALQLPFSCKVKQLTADNYNVGQYSNTDDPITLLNELLLYSILCRRCV